VTESLATRPLRDGHPRAQLLQEFYGTKSAIQRNCGCFGRSPARSDVLRGGKTLSSSSPPPPTPPPPPPPPAREGAAAGPSVLDNKPLPPRPPSPGHSGRRNQRAGCMLTFGFVGNLRLPGPMPPLGQERTTGRECVADHVSISIARKPIAEAPEGRMTGWSGCTCRARPGRGRPPAAP